MRRANVRVRIPRTVVQIRVRCTYMSTVVPVTTYIRERFLLPLTLSVLLTLPRHVSRVIIFKNKRELTPKK